MADETGLIPLQQSITSDLQDKVTAISDIGSKTAGLPNVLDDNRKRWLVVGICLHSVISPTLRTYIAPVLTNLYNALIVSDNIDKQTHNTHLKLYKPTNKGLNYEAINTNYDKFGKSVKQYDYKVYNAVDLSKLFLQTHMAKYTAIGDSCDSSALLGIIINIDKFLPSLQSTAKAARLIIRNPWAHCDFTEWDSIKFLSCFKLMEQIIKDLQLNASDELSVLGDLSKWEKSGISFLSGTPLGLELVNEIREQTRGVAEYAQTVAVSADDNFVKIQIELVEMTKTFDDRITYIERELEKKAEDDKLMQDRLLNLEENNTLLENELRRRDQETIPKHKRAQHEDNIKQWQEDDKKFCVTRATEHVISKICSSNIAVVTGCSGSEPIATIRADLEKILQTENKFKHCALVLCLIFEEGFDEQWLKFKLVSNDIQTKIKGIGEEFDINLDLEILRRYLIDAFYSLAGTYLRNRDDNMEESYFRRLLGDLEMKNVNSTLHNKQLVYESFRMKLIKFFERNIVVTTTIFNQLDESGIIMSIGNEDDEDYDDYYIDANVDECNDFHNGYTPLEVACKGGFIDIVQLLLEKKSDINHNEGSPLFLACQNGHTDIVELLLVNDANITPSSFEVACENGCTTIVDSLLQKKNTISLYFDKLSPLHLASGNGHLNVVETLINSNINISHFDKWSSLCVASHVGHIDIVKILAQSETNIHFCDKNGYSPMYAACQGGNIDIVQFLIQQNVNLFHSDKRGQSLLHALETKMVIPL
ncbi:Hypothetical predicted protein [Mytilus galloprovincialis]|uniref:DZIP3-like HEPN domain-containing protein n=1 Tax=Mytilus galloprovincialis TaxID=29158 RepID=A0A8B6D4C4_MYTGA|nr:Hypothetical predicted protein [Mytilus galloprovincialis]